jgi:hypothetical protein
LVRLGYHNLAWSGDLLDVVEVLEAVVRIQDQPKALPLEQLGNVDAGAEARRRQAKFNFFPSELVCSLFDLPSVGNLRAVQILRPILLLAVQTGQGTRMGYSVKEQPHSFQPRRK